MVKHLPAIQETQETQVRSLGQEYPPEKGMATHQYSYLENPMGRGTWQVTVHRVAKSQAQLSNWTTTITTAERKENIKLP